MEECVIKGTRQELNWLIVAAFRYCVNRHTTQAMWDIEKVILNNLDILYTEFIRQFVRDIEREQEQTLSKQKDSKERYAVDYFARLKAHVEDYQRCLKHEKGDKQQEPYKKLCEVMELIPQVDMSYKWQYWQVGRIDDTTYLTPMLDSLKQELNEREGGINNG